MSPTDKLLDKLSKMVAARDGEAAIGNSAAAEAFAEAINRLLIQHELSASDIPLSGAKDEPVVEQLVDLEQFGIKFSRVRIGWQEALARIVAPAHLCKFLVTKGSNCITFVGTRQHVAVAEYAYGVLCSAADRMSMQAREEWWRNECGGQHLKSNGFRGAWLTGFIQRIGERFKEARATEVKAAASSSTALMRLDQALVRAKDYVDAKYKKPIPAAQMGGENYDGYRAGRKAADEIALGRKGVEGGGSVRKIGGGL